MQYQINRTARMPEVRWDGHKPGDPILLFGCPEEYKELLSHQDFMGLITPNTSISTNVRSSISEISQGHGAIVGDSLIGSLTVNLELLVIDTDRFRRGSRFDRILAQGYQGLTQFLEIAWDEETEEAPEGQLRAIRGLRTVTKPRIVHEQGWTKTVQWQLEAGHPFIEGALRTNTFAADAVFNLVNEGNAPSFAEFWAYGPYEGFDLVNNANGRALTINEEIEAGDWIYINTRTRSVLKNGVENLSGSVDHNTNDFWFVDPLAVQPCQFAVHGGEGAETELRVANRPTWW